MNILVTGLPRHRTSLIIQNLSKKFNLLSPLNQWGETHKFNETIHNWLDKDNCVFKVWAPFNDNFNQILEMHNGSIVVSYSEDLPLFVAKLLRAHVLRDYAIELQQVTPISFKDNIKQLEEIQPYINSFRDGLNTIFQNKKILCKCVFVNDDKVFAHIQSSVDPLVINMLTELCLEWQQEEINRYIHEIELPEYYEYIYKTFGNTICN